MATSSESSKRSAARPYSTGGRPIYQVASRRRFPRYTSAASTQAAPGAVYGGPATRQVAGEVGTGAEASYPRYQVPTGVEAGETEIYGGDANAPADVPSERISTPEIITERQGVIANRALGPLRERGTLFGDLLGGLSTEKANPNFNPNAPIGGENIPFQPTSGLRGFFQRFGGNRANELNLGAQAEQAAEWRDKAAREEKRLADIETYRTQRGIDKEIEDARDEKRNAQAITMFEKAQAAQKELLGLQQDFTKAQSADERAAILDRIQKQHTNALDLQTRALAASEKNLGLQQAFQTRLANFNAQLDDYANQNKITQLGNGFFSRGGEVYGLTPGTPGYGNVKGTEPSVTDPLLGPAAEGRQLPQMSVDGGSSAPIRSPRFQVPSVSNQGGILEAPVEPLQPPAPEPTPKPTPPPMPPMPLGLEPNTEEGEYIKGLIPSIGEYITSDTEAPNFEQDAPGTAPYLAGFGRAMGDIGRRISEGGRSVKPLLFGGKLPRYSEETGGSVLGALLNAPGAMLTPIEAAGNYVMRNPVTALTGADPRTGQPILQKAQSPDTLYMTDEQYKNYLRKQRRGL